MVKEHLRRMKSGKITTVIRHNRKVKVTVSPELIKAIESRLSIKLKEGVKEVEIGQERKFREINRFSKKKIKSGI